MIEALGWRAIYESDGLTSVQKNQDKPAATLTSKSKKEDAETLLPKVKKGDSVAVKSCRLTEGKTKAPSLYNESSLLGAMETAGKFIDDEEAREAMKECGLGTPATRASILGD